MIEHIQWHPSRHDEPKSPFEAYGVKRPLRLTFHTQSFAKLSPVEAALLEVLRDLASLPDVESFETDLASDSRFEVVPEPWDDDHIPVRVRRPDGRCNLTGILFPKQWP